MIESTEKKYERRATPIERLFTRSPFSTVTMVARIRGSVSESMLRNAILKVRQRHPHLRARIVDDDEGNPWFTSEGAGEIPAEIAPRESGEHWIKVVQAACQIPYEFDVRPPIRFILLQSADTSDLIILCHHIICDGLSLAYLARDLMVHLGDADREVEVLPDPAPIGRDNIPADVSVNAVARYFIRRMNRKWAEEKVVFDQEDYRVLSQAYWLAYQHQMLSVELSEAQTSALVERCRLEGVTVNSALSAAFVGAQTVVQSAKSQNPNIGVGASLRDRLPTPAGEVMGFYAGVASSKFKYDEVRGFWDNARQFHRKVRSLYTNKHLFQDLANWCYLEPTILEAVNFKKLGGLVSRGSASRDKIAAFGAREDIVLQMLKRGKIESLDRLTMGTAVTNLGRLDFPARYGALELERLIMKPGGAFPLANVNLVLGAATCAGRLSLLVEFVETNVDVGTMAEINDSALELLL